MVIMNLQIYPKKIINKKLAWLGGNSAPTPPGIEFGGGRTTTQAALFFFFFFFLWGNFT
jgi:hypothetical protein